MESPWKPLLLLSVISGLSEFSGALAGIPASYGAVLRMPTDSLPSSLASRTRPRHDRRAGPLEPGGWAPPLSPHHLSTLGVWGSQEEDRRSEENAEFGPVLIQEPDDTVFPLESEEKKVTMICEARGNPLPTYRWIFNGTELDVQMDFRYTQIEGGLIISEPSEDRDYGMYQCKATNVFGTVLSRDALLQFAYLGNFSMRARGGVSVREGQGVVLMCTPPSHSPEITYSWVFNEFPSFVVRTAGDHLPGNGEPVHLQGPAVRPPPVCADGGMKQHPGVLLAPRQPVTRNDAPCIRLIGEMTSLPLAVFSLPPICITSIPFPQPPPFRTADTSSLTLITHLPPEAKSSQINSGQGTGSQGEQES
ncbi:hypothetical protein SKAU_G00086670 [Synaphobranchus kaupii]|uniref:Ig-like domain-containing protein n=1 Tax=Synaphobranchus kaupii TaxID=118154 RepID=A0A9Q1FWF1_SYNKA|nr:hypothetical protein SKAU_G00086670 [Synaphobranchus kaupii]